MSPNDIEVGKTYSNGKEGPRSYSERKVLKMGVEVRAWDLAGTIRHDGVRFLQTAGPYKGKESVLQLKSFATWAREEVE